MAHIENQFNHHDFVNDSTLHVIGVCSNPARWASRYRLARQFAEEMSRTPNVKFYLVEAAFGDHHHEVTVSDNEQHLQVRTRSQTWIKENMGNLALRYLLPKDAKYICFADMDISFRNPNWALETIKELQHHAVVQPWSQCLDLGPHGSVIATHQSFCYVYQTGKKMQRNPKEPYIYPHTGYCWAYRRDFLENTQGLLDVCILGSADHHMAFSLINEGMSTIPKEMSQGYHHAIKSWQRKAIQVTHNRVGFVPGRIEHSWHGSKDARQYRSRWQILIENHYDPETDLMRDPQGVIHLVGKHKMEEEILRYNRSRNEDGVDE